MAASSLWWETCGSHVKHVTKTQGVVTAAVRAVRVSVRARFLSPYYSPDAAHISHLPSDRTTVLIPVLEMRTLREIFSVTSPNRKSRHTPGSCTPNLTALPSQSAWLTLAAASPSGLPSLF